ncbi:hypothetical protein AWB71_02801 [Caballeronia peredens]|nr:hypothetical protein AWB71_02801 [Caballeronia peredens]
MKELWNFALQNPGLLILPTIAFAITLLLLRVKQRYVNEGVIFGRAPAEGGDPSSPKSSEDDEMNADNPIDIGIALRRFQELDMEEGEQGYAYWYRVGQLLKRADSMQAEIDALSEELELCRARRRKAR